MARKTRHSTLENRTRRLAMVPKGKPYAGPALGRGIKLLYRRTKTGNGSWVVKVADGHGGHWTDAFAQADDRDDSNGRTILTYFEASDAAKKLARGEEGVADSAPLTVEGALDRYKIDLETRGADTYNAVWPRLHLTPSLMGKPVALLGADELKRWRDGLLDGGSSPVTINRFVKGLRAALELAARLDSRRIKNPEAWRVGLTSLPNAESARNVILTDDEVRAFVKQAYARDAQLGLLVDVLATTGARPSQAIRLRVGDLHDHPSKPKLSMPKSGKGGGQNRAEKKIERFSVPITVQLVKWLKVAASNRPEDAPLLLRSDGQPWSRDPLQDYRRDVVEIVTAIGRDPGEVSMYSLRHSSITRALLAHVPPRLVAAMHDTSVSQVEKNYSKHIAEHADDLARAALLHHDDAPPTNVVKLVR